MSYRFDFDVSPRKDIRRIAEAEIARAILLLAEQPDGPHLAVHSARKRIKRLRALYRFAAHTDRSFQRSENHRLRTIQHGLAHARDAAALVETAAALKNHTITQEEREAIGKVEASLVERRDRLTSKETALAATIPETIRALEKSRQALASLDLDKDRHGFAIQLASRWEKTGRTALGLMTITKEGNNPAALHDLRKRCQDRWMQALLLRSAWPAGFTALAHQSKELIDLIGLSRDLGLLSDAIRDEPQLDITQDEETLIAPLINRLQSDLNRQAVVKAHELFITPMNRERQTIATLILRRMDR